MHVSMHLLVCFHVSVSVCVIVGGVYVSMTICLIMHLCVSACVHIQ